MGEVQIKQAVVLKHNKPHPRVAHRAVSPNWPKIESGRPMVSPHLPWKFHAVMGTFN